jgi:hypothetical protein
MSTGESTEVCNEMRQNGGAVTQVPCAYQCFDPQPNLPTVPPRIVRHEVEDLEKATPPGETGKVS